MKVHINMAFKPYYFLFQKKKKKKKKKNKKKKSRQTLHETFFHYNTNVQRSLDPLFLNQNTIFQLPTFFEEHLNPRSRSTKC